MGIIHKKLTLLYLKIYINNGNFNLTLKMKSGSINQLFLFFVSTVPFKNLAEEVKEFAIITLDFGLE